MGMARAGKKGDESGKLQQVSGNEVGRLDPADGRG